MAIADSLTTPLLDQELESLFRESIANPCDCDHAPCSTRCKGHHLKLIGVESSTGFRREIGGTTGTSPCASSASWVVTIQGRIPGGHVPPAPRYLCDTCKEFWSKSSLSLSRVEKL